MSEGERFRACALQRRGGDAMQAFDGLMATGDMGHLDDHGRLFVEGRDEQTILPAAANVDELPRNR